jgi:mycothiol synthase
VTEEADVPLQIAPLADANAASALAVLTDEEEAVGVPLVDEAERWRLERLVAERERAAGWTPIVAYLDEGKVGYGAVLVDEDGGPASGDAAVTGRGAEAGALPALLTALADVAGSAGASRLQVWVRHAGEPELAAAREAGFAVERRLGVLGRDLDEEVTERETDDGVEVRSFRPDEDDDEVVAVLAAAYAGTNEAGWDLARFRERRGWGWFRPEDLLVAEIEDGRLGGIHWLKRREDGAGEVYNLAIHPDAQGRGLGPALLHAGLAHLRRLGCHEVLLWVDLANERAARLYTSEGFATRWEDVALGRELRGRATDAP